jgi:hypothetical protein
MINPFHANAETRPGSWGFLGHTVEKGQVGGNQRVMGGQQQVESPTANELKPVPNEMQSEIEFSLMAFRSG